MKLCYPLVSFLVIILSLSNCSNDEQQAQSRKAATAAKQAAKPDHAHDHEAEQQNNSKADLSKILKSEVYPFFNVSSFNGNDLSHDGSLLLYSSNYSGTFNAYSVPFNGGESKQLTNSTKDPIYVISWFPSDSRILYSSKESKNEFKHLYVIEKNGEIKDITPGHTTNATFAGWSSDSSQFWVLLSERVGGPFSIYSFNSENYSKELVFNNESRHTINSISYDGRWAVSTKASDEMTNSVYILDLKQENPQPKEIAQYSRGIAFKIFTFTRDNKHLIYGSNEQSEFVQAWSYDLNTGKKRSVLKKDWDIDFIKFSNTGKYKILGINENGQTKLMVTNTNTNHPVKLPKLPHGQIGGIRFSKDDKRMVLYINSDTSSLNLYSVDLSNNQVRKLTDAFNGSLEPANLSEGEIVSFNSFDKLKISGILYKPKNASAKQVAPALVYAHQAPEGQHRKSFKSLVQYIVSKGYAVFAVNHRGAKGYGKTFETLDNKKHGEDSLQDIIYGRKYLESLNWVDNKKIGVMGSSYGGYMVIAALAFEPDSFEVGINLFGIADWGRILNNISDHKRWKSFKQYMFNEMGNPETDEKRLQKISPIYHVQNITKPMMVVQGERDTRALKEETDEMVAVVKSNKVPVEYLIFPNELHGISNTENHIKFLEKAVEFLDEYLAKKS